MCPRCFVFSELRYILLVRCDDLVRLSTSGLTTRRRRSARVGSPSKGAFCSISIVPFPWLTIRYFSTFPFFCFSRRRQPSSSAPSGHTLTPRLASTGNGFLWTFRGTRKRLNRWLWLRNSFAALHLNESM